MSDEPQLPRAARAFVSFVALLRANGFAVAPEQTTAFLAAIELLGPREPRGHPPGRRSPRWRRRPSAAPTSTRCSTSTSSAARRSGAGEGERRRDSCGCRTTGAARTSRRSPTKPTNPAQAATRAEALVERRFGPADASEALRRLAREAAGAPAAAARPSAHARRGAAPCADLRRTLRDAARNDGEMHAARRG